MSAQNGGPLEFHLGADYACVLLPGQSTDEALARIYGRSKVVERYGKLFAAAPELSAALQLYFAADPRFHKAASDALAKAGVEP